MLYIHIPLCSSKCHYCSFYSVASAAASTSAIVEATCRELQMRKNEYVEPLRTIYFGGGTPTLLTVEEIEKIFIAIRENYNTTEVKEITIEGNAEHMTTEFLEGVYALGVNRLSIGIQSFNEERLLSIGRKHTAADAVSAIERARKVGFKNISIDLMFGFEDLTNEEWEYSINRALECNIEHISAYQLSIEPGTVFARRGVECATDEKCFEQYTTLCKKLSEGGFEHYEISNFAREGFRSSHNSGYWTGEKYLGIGASAHSYDGARVRKWNVNSVKDYINNVESEEEHLTDEDLHNEYLMTRLRTADGFSLDEYAEKFAKKFKIEDGLQLSEDRRVYIEEKNLFIADSIISSYFEI